jgi:hypothetical protein
VKRLLSGIVLAFMLAGFAGGTVAFAAAPAAASNATASTPIAVQEPPAVVPSKPIPYKKEESGTGAAAGKSILILAILLGLAWLALVLAKRYLPQLRLNLPLPLKASGERRLKLVETLRVGPRTSLYLVQFDRQTLLLAQSGDNITVAAGEVGAGIDNKDNDVAKHL